MKRQFDSIIFDMDGVLVSNDSYVKAIINTVQLYSNNKCIDSTYVTEIKKITGFNNDWDTSYALITLLGNNVPVYEFKNAIEQITPQIRISDLYVQIKNTFQKLYLGINDNGYIANETLIITIPILKKLSDIYALGIATSRPRYEAQYAARNLGLTDYIPLDYIVAKEDAPREKPFPDPLLEAKKRMNVQRPVYIGDTINDTKAAKSAGIPCIYVPNTIQVIPELEGLL
jgi:HAD superfamily hydrolase (TIGR01548 family)